MNCLPTNRSQCCGERWKRRSVLLDFPVHDIDRGRFCLQRGLAPRLMSPLQVGPYVKFHKNNERNADAIAEAATRPAKPFVAINSEEQPDVQARPCSRERLVHNRTCMINQGRGLLREHGTRIGLGRHVFQRTCQVSWPIARRICHRAWSPCDWMWRWDSMR